MAQRSHGQGHYYWYRLRNFNNRILWCSKLSAIHVIAKIICELVVLVSGWKSDSLWNSLLCRRHHTPYFYTVAISYFCSTHTGSAQHPGTNWHAQIDLLTCRVYFVEHMMISTQVRHHTHLHLITCRVCSVKHMMIMRQYFPRLWYDPCTLHARGLGLCLFFVSVLVCDLPVLPRQLFDSFRYRCMARRVSQSQFWRAMILSPRVSLPQRMEEGCFFRLFIMTQKRIAVRRCVESAQTSRPCLDYRAPYNQTQLWNSWISGRACRHAWWEIIFHRKFKSSSLGFRQPCQ